MQHLTKHDLLEICRGALYEAHNKLKSLGSKGTKEHGRAENIIELSTVGDTSVSESLRDYFIRQNIPATLFSEEFGRIEISKQPHYAVCYDDIDGSNNYMLARDLFPHSTVVTIFDSPQPRFGDAIVAGVLEHRSGYLWHAIRGEGCYLNGERTRPSDTQTLSKRSVLAIDHFYEDNVRMFSRLYEKAIVKDFSSAAFHMACVSSGILDAYVSGFQKAHELGAGYLLLEEAGAYLKMSDGSNLDGVQYDFNARYPIVAAATQSLGEEIRKDIAKLPQ